MSNTTKRSADLKIHAVVGDGDKAEFIFLGTGYQNRSGSQSILLHGDWQLVNKTTGQVLEAVAAERDGTSFMARVKLLIRRTKAAASKAA